MTEHVKASPQVTAGALAPGGLAILGAAGPCPTQGPMARLRLELRLPEGFWLASLSRACRGSLLWVLDLAPFSGRGALLHVWADDRTSSQVRSWGRRLPRGVHLEELHRSAQGTLWRVRYPPSVLVPLISQGEVLPRVPFAVRDGWAFWEVLGSRVVLQRLAELVRHGLPGSRVLGVSSTVPDTGPAGLTPTQERVFQEALRCGYYEHPRRISLTGLARKLGLSKGSLSVMLHRIECRLAHDWQETRALPRFWVPGPPGRDEI